MTNTTTSDRESSQNAGLGSRRSANFAMWAMQGLLAAMFVFAGGMKLVMPVETMNQGELAAGIISPIHRLCGAAWCIRTRAPLGVSHPT
jgi:hypothetical protein